MWRLGKEEVDEPPELFLEGIALLSKPVSATATTVHAQDLQRTAAEGLSHDQCCMGLVARTVCLRFLHRGPESTSRDNLKRQRMNERDYLPH